MPKPRVLILRAPGTNCDQETQHAFELAGAICQRIHINQLLEDPQIPTDFQILCIPGGFSYGDDVAAGRILATQIEHHLRDALLEMKFSNKLILGICNGFQVLIKSGLLLTDSSDEGSPATLTWNDSGIYTDRWVNLAVDGNKSVFLRGLNHLYLPIAHAEGKFIARDEPTLQALAKNQQLALRYALPAVGAPATAEQANSTEKQPQTAGDAILAFPHNPNGSQANVAGLCDETGHLLGLMPHPERFIDFTQHPRWTRHQRSSKNTSGDGLAIFQNAVQYFA